MKYKTKPGCGACPQLKVATKSILFDRTKYAWDKMTTSFEKFDNNLRIISVSPWLSERAKNSYILNKFNNAVI